MTKRTALTRADEIRVELLSYEAAAEHVGAWRALTAASLEPNGFFEPGFALAAARYLERGRVQFLFVWAGSALIGLCPLQLPGSAPWTQLRVLTHPQVALGVPLLERARAAEALAAILTYCREHLSHRHVLMVPLLPQDGPTARLLAAGAKTEGREIRMFGAYQRPVLAAGIDPTAYSQRTFNAGRRQKLNKARRRLGALGPVRFRLLVEPDDLDAASEEFLALEARGWKGRRGTALVVTSERAAFATSMLAALAAEGKLMIGRLACGDVPVAMALVLKSGGRAFYWKLAYDENYAPYSPGVLMSLELTRALAADVEIAMTDSCAGPDQMIGHLWNERMAVADFFVALDTNRHRFLASCALELGRRAVRCRLKSLVLILRGMNAAAEKRLRSQQGTLPGC